MKRLSLFCVLACLSSPAFCQDGSFPQPAGWGEMTPSVHQQGGAGLTGGSASVPSGAPGPAASPTAGTVVNPGGIDQKQITVPKKPTPPQSQNNQNQQPQMPSMGGAGSPSDSQQQQTPQNGNQLASQSQTLGQSTQNLKTKLAQANPSDPATKARLAKAQRTVAQGETAKSLLDQASGLLLRLKGDLSSANASLRSQDGLAQDAVKALGSAAKDRDSVLGSVVTAPPSCSPGSRHNLANPGLDKSAISDAKGEVSKAEGLLQKARGLVADAAGTPADIQASAAEFQAAGTAAAAKLGSSVDLGDAAAQIAQVGTDAQAYVAKVRTVILGAEDALKSSKAAVEAAEKAAQAIRSAQSSSDGA
ncbi:MAG: hypothetical protein KGL53_05165, partial [Elusimicrobia bacterium]|nr:hypothetical protein [Elusimicrobiota bacterium]